MLVHAGSFAFRSFSKLSAQAAGNPELELAGIVVQAAWEVNFYAHLGLPSRIPR